MRFLYIHSILTDTGKVFRGVCIRNAREGVFLPEQQQHPPEFAGIFQILVQKRIKSASVSVITQTGRRIPIANGIVNRHIAAAVPFGEFPGASVFYAAEALRKHREDLKRTGEHGLPEIRPREPLQRELFVPERQAVCFADKPQLPCKRFLRQQRRRVEKRTALFFPCKVRGRASVRVHRFFTDDASGSCTTGSGSGSAKCRHADGPLNEQNACARTSSAAKTAVGDKLPSGLHRDFVSTAAGTGNTSAENRSSGSFLSSARNSDANKDAFSSVKADEKPRAESRSLPPNYILSYHFII